MLTHCVPPSFDRSMRPAGARFPADQSIPLSRALLLGSVAAVTLFIAAPQQSALAGPAVCALSGTTVTCTGDQSGGIASGTDFTAPPVDTLIVKDLTEAIAPDPGDAGISFEVPDGNNVTISSDTGGFGISTTGGSADGIFGKVDGDGDVSVTSTGNISTNGNGAEGIFGYVAGSGNAFVTSTGNISTNGSGAEGIYGYVEDDGNVSITSTGNITTMGGGEGIYGYVHGNGNVTITSTGDVTTMSNNSEGLYGYVKVDGDVSITSTGNISTLSDGARGIYGKVNDDGDVTISNTGDVTTTGLTHSDGIFGRVNDDGNVSITSMGNVSTKGSNSEGIFGYVLNDGNIDIANLGNISTTGEDSEGIYGRVLGNGDVTITSTGDVSTQSSFSYGIFGRVFGDGNVAFTSLGDISTDGEYSDGIYGRVDGIGDVTITSTGNISTQGEHAEAIYGFSKYNGNVAISSTGDISTAGEGSDGIYGRVNGTGADGSVVITSTGDISTQEDDSEGIYGAIANDGDVTITSTGSVSTSGIEAEAIYGRVDDDGNVAITSTGNVSTSADGSVAILGHMGGNGDMTITSSGDITTAGTSAHGIYGLIDITGDMTIAHTGNITAAQSYGIRAYLDGTGNISITHSGGTISGTTGIHVDDHSGVAPATLNLFGTVTGTGGTAIDLNGDGHDVVNLNAGAVINGTIDFGNGNDGLGGTNPDDIDTLNAGPGFNGVIYFADEGGTDADLESAPETITGKFVLTNGGEQAVFADITSGLAANAVLLDDLVGSILGDIDSQNAGVVETQGPTGDEQPLGYAPLKKTANVARFDVFDEIKPSYRVWGTGFGALTEQKGTATTLNSDIGFAGAMAGIETAVHADFVAGIFLGRAMSRIDVAFNSMDMETGSTFAGVYTRHNWDETWLNFTLLGGWSDHDDVRYVGATQARADYNSFFVAPSVTLGTRLSGILPDHDVLPSLRVNYTGQFIEGYTETGVALPLSVNSRNVHLLSSRAQIAVPYSWTQSNGTALKIEGVVGVDGTLNLGDDSVQTTIAGSPLDFSTKFANASASGFVGASFEFLSADNRYAVNTSAEGHLDIDGSLALRGKVSVSGRF